MKKLPAWIFNALPVRCCWQGSFDVFLKATPSERAPILEQITGTEIYSKISIGVFERSKKEVKRLEDLQANLAAIQLLSEEDQKSHALEYQEKSEAHASLAKKLLSLNEHKTWRNEVDRISFGLKDLECKWNDYVKEEQAAHPNLKKLEQAAKALNFDGEFRELGSLKDHQKNRLENLSKAMHERSILENTLIEKNNDLKIIHGQFNNLLEDQKQELYAIKIVRDLDKDGERERKRLNELSARITKEEEHAAGHKKALEEHQKKDETLQTRLRNIQTYFETHSSDESLIEKFSSIQINFDRYKENKKSIEAKQKEYSSSLERLKEAKKQISGYQKTYNLAKESTEKAKSRLKTLSEDYEALSNGRDSLQWDKERKALELEEKLTGGLKAALEHFQNQEGTQKTTLETIQTFKVKLDACRKKEEDVQLEKEKLDQKTVELLGQQALQNRIQSLEEERSQLCDNAPCPLCGSLEHPYAHENTPDLRKVDEQLKEVGTASKALLKIIHGLAKEVSEIETEIRNCAKRQIEEVKLLDQLKEKIFELSEQIGCYKKSAPTIAKVTKQHEDSCKQLKEFEEKYNAYLKKIEDKEAAQKSYNKEFQNYSELEQQLKNLVTTQNQCDNCTNHLKQQQEQLNNEHSELQSSLLDSVRPYGIFTFTSEDSDTIKESLALRLTQWKQQQNAKKQVEEEIQTALVQITILKGHLERAESTLKTLVDEKKQCSGCVEELLRKRQHLFGAKNPDNEEELFKNLIEKARAHLGDLKDEFSKMQHQQESLVTRILELTKNTQERAQTLQRMEEKFNEQIHRVGFSDIEAYMKASLSHEERENLTNLKSSLENKKSELLADKKVAEKRFSELSQEPKTEETLSVLEEQINEVTQQLESIRDRVSSLKMILAENEKKLDGAIVLQDKIVQQNKETDIWKGLCSLIGASDGKKFRDFAQKMTLEMMITHANRQLVKMSDRYLLRQSKDTPLELEVVDNYQAGEERSVKNLSGGEGFIVSLSLALGLSQMSSSRVRVDTLFLDEGFGTLDERALEVALDTLSELHQEGKVIGLISHVTVLKERISTQIRVQPISGGRSRIEGPGCCEIKDASLEKKEKQASPRFRLTKQDLSSQLLQQ